VVEEKRISMKKNSPHTPKKTDQNESDVVGDSRSSAGASVA
jgi:hypothetical protein